jgi:hypothetical protein
MLDVSSNEIYLAIMLIILLCMLIIAILVNRSTKEKEVFVENVLNNIIPLCITNKEYDIVKANDSYWSIFGKPKSNVRAIKCYDHRPGKSCHTDKCALRQVINGAKEYVCESSKEYGGEEHIFIVTARPLYDKKNIVVGAIECFLEITDRKKLEAEKDELIAKLGTTLDKVNLLSGLIPICASCKKIRDDDGYWSQIEVYIRDHSEAEFSHGICPECSKRLYPELNNN